MAITNPRWTLTAGILLLPSLFAFQCSLDGLADFRRADIGGPREAGADGPSNGGFANQTVLTDLEAPDELAKDERYLYVTTVKDGGAVERCPIDSPETCLAGRQVVASGQSGVQSLIVTGGKIAWANSKSGDVMYGETSSNDGGRVSPAAIARGQASPAGVVPLERSIVWSNRDGAYGSLVVAGCALPTCQSIEPVARVAIKPGALLVRDRDALWIEEGKSFAETLIVGASSPGGDGYKSCRIYVSPDPVHHMAEGASDPHMIYWTSANGYVRRFRRPPAAEAIDDCDSVLVTATELARGQENPWDIAVDAQHVYFTVHLAEGRGSLRRVPIGGGDVEVLLSGLNAPRGIALDNTYVYVAVQGAGTIVRVAKTK